MKFSSAAGERYLVFFRFVFRVLARLRYCPTYLWFDQRDGEWTVTHRGVDYSDFAAINHQDSRVCQLGHVACDFNAGVVGSLDELHSENQRLHGELFRALLIAQELTLECNRLLDLREQREDQIRRFSSN